jgi:predicted TIM-barrel fold metal-dependent hydrolase
VAAAARVPVLIHAGLGVGSFGPVLLALAERHRGCPIILAHAAISDLCWLWEEVPAHPNLYFDTSWWIPSDLIAALLEEGAKVSQVAVPALAMATAHLLTPGVDSAVAVVA